MIFLIHSKSRSVVKVLQDEHGIEVRNSSCTKAFWELAERFPEELIGWCEKDFSDQLNLDHWKEIFHHDLIMASYAVKSGFLPPQVGYIDQLPFVNVNREVLYGTWRMSSDVGGIKGKVLSRFRTLLGGISDFSYLINSIAKIGQQNSLFCYSTPGLINKFEDPISEKKQVEPIEALTAKQKRTQSQTEQPALDRREALPTASTSQLFTFVYQHYNTPWIFVLLLCYLVYERSFPFLAFAKSFFSEKFFKKEVDLSGIEVNSSKEDSVTGGIDVIIPTIGRPQYLFDVLKDLAGQTHLPSKVIIVEQNPDENAVSELNFIKTETWPFKIVHHFIHQTGACNARNLALKETNAEWIFFADDDIRLKPNLLSRVMEETGKYQISAINLNCKQPGEETVFHKIKQWGSFGAGTSMVKNSYAQNCRFSRVFEFGFGEDADFGMQLRNSGCDIIYHPELQISHLKAPVGGFRKKPVLPWERGNILPKPSPTLMAYTIKHYTLEQIKGYRTSLFLKFYSRQPIKNPIKYLRQMRERWRLSEEWANKLLQENR